MRRKIRVRDVSDVRVYTSYEYGYTGIVEEPKHRLSINRVHTSEPNYNDMFDCPVVWGLSRDADRSSCYGVGDFNVFPSHYSAMKWLLKRSGVEVDPCD